MICFETLLMLETVTNARKRSTACDILVLVPFASVVSLLACGSSPDNFGSDYAPSPADSGDDGRLCRMPNVFYDSPGCGAQAKPICDDLPQDACPALDYFCACDGQTTLTGRCGISDQPYLHMGPCQITVDGSSTDMKDGTGDALHAEAGAPVAECSESASTNSGAILVLVYSDGSATRTVGSPNWGTPYDCPDGGCNCSTCPGSTSYYPPGSQTHFLEDLRAVGDLSNIHGTWCGKSASFGTTTTVTSDGKTSVDLQCMQNPTPAQCALYYDCLGLTGLVESSIGGGPAAGCGFQ